MKPPRNIIGPVVRCLRSEKGLTQADFAAKLNLLGWDISRETLAKIETQIRWVSDFEIEILAHALAIEPGDLFRQVSASRANIRLTPDPDSDIEH